MYIVLTGTRNRGGLAFVCRSGFFVGTGADTFSPNVPMTRGMFVTVLAQVFKNFANAAQ